MPVRPTKFLAAAAFFAVSTQAYALDFTTEASRIVSDPLYLPLQGQFFGATSYKYGTATQDEFDSTGAKVNSARIDTNTIEQQLMYGVTDDFTLRFDWSYDPSRDVSRHLVPTGSNTRSSSGWTDPAFGATYRVLEQGNNPFSLDLRADYSPDAFPAKGATAFDEGTVARGGQSADFGATIGHQTRDFTIAATFDADYLDTRKIENQTVGGFTRTDALWNYALGLDTQTRLTDQVSVNAGVGHTFINNAYAFNTFNGLAHATRGGDATSLNASLNYHFVPNTVVGSIDYQHNFYDNSRNLFPTSPVSDSEIRNKNEDVIGVTLRYVVP